MLYACIVRVFFVEVQQWIVKIYMCCSGGVATHFDVRLTFRDSFHLWELTDPNDNLLLRCDSQPQLLL